MINLVRIEESEMTISDGRRVPVFYVCEGMK